jgi:hypothetical protein
MSVVNKTIDGQEFYFTIDPDSNGCGDPQILSVELNGKDISDILNVDVIREFLESKIYEKRN